MIELPSPIIYTANWLAGWRVDLDGWWVRARRTSDPELNNASDIGFTAEACVAVRSPRLAFDYDRGRI